MDFRSRTSRRHRALVLAILANAGSKVTSLLVLLVSVPLTAGYLGDERFGAWMTISSFAALLSFADLGVSNGLLNKVAHTSVNAGRERLALLVRNALGLLVGLAFCVGLLLLAAAEFVSVNAIIRTSQAAIAREVSASLAVFGVLFVASLPLTALQRVFMGLQESHAPFTVNALANAASLLLLLVLSSREAGIPSLLLATYGVQTLAPLLLVPQMVRRGLITLRGTFSSFVADSKELLGVGTLFFGLQLGSMVAWGSDSVIVSSQIGAAEVAGLAAASRLFKFVVQPLALINTPLWSAYADAMARGDYAFVRKSFVRSLSGTVAIALAGAVVLFFCRSPILTFWLGGALHISDALMALCAAWAFVEAIGFAFAMFLNGVGVVRPQLIVVSLFCLVGLPLKLLLVQRFGVEGVIAAGLIAYLIAVVVPYASFLRGTWLPLLSNPRQKAIA